jgi:hypothetical protein
MDAYTLLDIESISNGEKEPTVPKVAVKIPRGC